LRGEKIKFESYVRKKSKFEGFSIGNSNEFVEYEGGRLMIWLVLILLPHTKPLKTLPKFIHILKTLTMNIKEPTRKKDY
jgi:hypothetical protein